MGSPLSFNINLKDKGLTVGSGNDKLQIGKDGVSIAGIPILGKGPGTPGAPPVLGPLSKLDLNKYQSDQSLMYPLDLANYKHYIRFNINIPEKSNYVKDGQSSVGGGIVTSTTGGAASGVTDVNRAATNQLGNSKGIPAGAAVAGGFVSNLKNVVKNLIGKSPNIAKAVGAGAGGLLVGAATGFVTTNRKTRRLAQTIFLYVPDTVQQTVVNNYDAVSMTEALGRAGAVSQGVDAVGTALSDNAKDILQRVGLGSGRDAGSSSEAASKAVAAEAAGNISGSTGQFGGGIKDALLFSAGYAQNPQIEILYKGVNNREFQFDFKFTPKSQKESEQVLNIIRAFKFHSAPELVQGASGSRYLIPPSEFDIQFMFGGVENSAIHKIATCVLEGIDVNYVTGGQFSTYADGMPIEIAMQLRFKEVEIIHKGLVEKGY